MDAVSPLLSESKVYSFQKNRTIYYEGSPKKGVYRVLKGRVKLCKHPIYTFRTMLFHLVYPSDFFGLSDFFNPSRISYFTAIAMDEEVLVEFISSAKFKEYMAQNTDFFLTIFQSFLEREENIWERYWYQRFENSYHIVYQGLQRLAKEIGVKKEEGTLIYDINQKELADYLGMYRQRINDAFYRLEREGKISYNRQYILLLK